MRFCMVSTFYPPYSFGGDAISVQQLSRALVRWGHQVTVVHDMDAYAALSTGPLPAAGPAEDDEGVEVIRLQSRASFVSALLVHQLGRPVLHASRLRELLQSGRFDAVIFHNPSLIGGPAILTWPRNAVTVYMAREHWLVCPTHVLWRHQRERCDRRQCLRCVLAHGRPPQAWRYTGALPRALAQVDLVVALSEFSRTKHRELGIGRPIEVLPNFVPDADLDEQPATPRPQARPYVLFAGRLERLKGLDDVIPVFRDLPDLDLLIAGKGDHGAALQRLAAGLPNVRFLGQLPFEEIGRHYRHALAGLVSSVGYEAFGRAHIEALSAGAPIVARDVGPAREVVGLSGAGLLFATPGELREALHRLATDADLRTALARRTLPAVRLHWSEGVILPRLLQLIESTAARRGLPLTPGPAARVAAAGAGR